MNFWELMKLQLCISWPSFFLKFFFFVKTYYYLKSYFLIMSWNKIEFEEMQKLGGNLRENMAQWSWTMNEFIVTDTVSWFKPCILHYCCDKLVWPVYPSLYLGIYALTWGWAFLNGGGVIICTDLIMENCPTFCCSITCIKSKTDRRFLKTMIVHFYKNIYAVVYFR